MRKVLNFLVHLPLKVPFTFVLTLIFMLLVDFCWLLMIATPKDGSPTMGNMGMLIIVICAGISRLWLICMPVVFASECFIRLGTSMLKPKSISKSNPLSYVLWTLFGVLVFPCLYLCMHLYLMLNPAVTAKTAEIPYFFASPQVKLKHELDQQKLDHVLQYLQKGADINTRNNAGQTALTIALQHTRYDLAATLVNQGADINTPGNNALDLTLIQKYSGYSETSKTTNPERVKMAFLLLNKGSFIFNPQDILNGAVQTGSIELVDELLKKGVSINKTIRRNHTYSVFCTNSPLSAAAETGNNQMVEFLLKQGAHVNGEDAQLSCSPLLQAIKNKHSDTALLLIQKGADVDSVDGYGFTALMKASQSSDELYETLIRHGANIHASTPYGHTVITESDLGTEQKTKILFKYLKPKGNVIIIQPNMNSLPWDSVTGKSLQEHQKLRY